MSDWKELDMSERTVIITGCSRGIGRVSALQLAKRGAKVIMACRDTEKAEEVRKEIVNVSKNEKVALKKIDLNNLNQVRSFAQGILSTEIRLDALICNAGANFKDKVITVDGLEQGFSTNYLGHFLLILQLLPLMKKTPSSRIVMVSSMLYLYGQLDFENLNGEKSYGEVSFYCNQKLAILLFMKEMVHKLNGTNVTINTVHPGIVITDMLRSMPGFLLAKYLVPCLLDDIETSASSSVFLATCADLDGISGKFFNKRKQTSLAPHADNAAVAKMLWKVSCKHAGINPDEI